MGLDLHSFRLPPGAPVRLEERPTRIEPAYASKAEYRERLAKRVKAVERLQRALYAERRRALLVVLQSMDAGGKDGAVRHVFSGVNPQGCQVHNFEPPSREELRHDFLWRTEERLPPRGCIGVFNRSYYEEVLVVRVHRDLLGPEGLADVHPGRSFWEGRFRSIVDHEAHLARNGYTILKIYLHLSKDEQRRRFLSRMEQPDKRWKVAPADLEDRARWDDYREAYEACLAATGSEAAPWYVVPADDKKTARLIIADAVLKALKALDPAYPVLGGEDARRLEALERSLKADAAS